MCSYLVLLTGFVSADSVSDERNFAVPSVISLCAKLESCLLKHQPSFDALLCTFCLKGARRATKGGREEDGGHVSQGIKKYASASPPQLCPQVLPGLCDPSLTEVSPAIHCFLIW